MTSRPIRCYVDGCQKYGAQGSILCPQHWAWVSVENQKRFVEAWSPAFKYSDNWTPAFREVVCVCLGDMDAYAAAHPEPKA